MSLFKKFLVILIFSMPVKYALSAECCAEEFFINIAYKNLPLHEMLFLEEEAFKQLQKFATENNNLLNKLVATEYGQLALRINDILPLDNKEVLNIVESIRTHQAVISRLKKTATGRMVLQVEGGLLEFYTLPKKQGGHLGIINSYWAQRHKSIFFDIADSGAIAARKQDLGFIALYDNDLLKKDKQFGQEQNSRLILSAVNNSSFAAQPNGRYLARWADKKPDYKIEFVWNGEVFVQQKRAL